MKHERKEHSMDDPANMAQHISGDAPETAPVFVADGRRANSRALLLERAAVLRAVAEKLEHLAAALPENMSNYADEVLWDMVVSKRWL